MKVLARLASLVTLAACTILASATPSDFKTDVLDPPPPASSFPTYSILQSPFTVIFSACQPGELPNRLVADGCFSGVNRTDTDWTSIEFTYDNTPVLGSQPVDCSPAPSNNVFSQYSCDLDNNAVYVVDFSSGVIRDGDFFFVTETGVDPALFPNGTATVTSTATSTPEPGSLLLLATGLGCGLLTWKVRGA